MKTPLWREVFADVKLLLITLKWIWDKRHLPLTREHRELYEIIHHVYFGVFRTFPNLINPKDFNERIQWLKLFDQKEEIVRCSDKILARDYIRDRVGERHLVDLYQTCRHFDEIVFDALPNEFVIKTNHDSGSVILVREKTAFDKASAAKRIEASLKNRYGWDNGEWAYSYIHPKILVEEFLEPKRQTPIPDYKFHCVDGKVKWLQYIFDRKYGTKEVIVDSHGCVTNYHFDHNMQHVARFEKPKEWSVLCDIAEKLSSGWKYLRVDLYLNESQVYVGELTCYPLGGYYRGSGQRQLGKLLDFNIQTVMTPIYRKIGLLT